MKYDFIFIVLVYRNTKDLEDFFISFKLTNSKVIVVNSFYDDESEKIFKQIAKNGNADFISVPNKGYGAGNNRGIEYALKNYDFKYIVISNADVNIININIDTLKNYPEGIYAPSIRTLKGKQQNPHMPFHCKIIDKQKYKFFLKNNWKAIILFSALNRILRIFFLNIIRFFNSGKIYSAHGSFIVLPKNIVEKLVPLYDENVFLFTEEENLAMNARAQGIHTYYTPQIHIQHKEDGSTSTISDKQRDITRDSYLKFYQKWYLSKK